MENLYCDRLSGMFSLEKDGEAFFLGPMAHAILELKSLGYTPSQAREGVLRAFFNAGEAVPMDQVTKMAKLIKKAKEV